MQRLKAKNNDEIMNAICCSINDFNNIYNRTISINDKEESLLGQNGVFDSLELVAFLSIIESRLEDIYKKPFMIADEKAFSQNISPFSTINTLTNYILLLIDNSLEY